MGEVFFLTQNPSPRLLGVILPLHVFAMVCMFYLLYFVSKSLVLAETSKPASFYDYAGPFFLLWFFPVGIWIVQPRVNRLYSERKNAEPPIGTAPSLASGQTFDRTSEDTIALPRTRRTRGLRQFLSWEIRASIRNRFVSASSVPNV